MINFNMTLVCQIVNFIALIALIYCGVKIYKLYKKIDKKFSDKNQD